MNSAAQVINVDDLQPNIISNDADIENASLPDSNANLSGAAPKKPKNKRATAATAKKNLKLNNNIDNMSTLNAEEGTSRTNGVTSNGICHYLNEHLPSTSSTCRDYRNDNAELESDIDEDSDADNEVLSVSEDGCIYTYKGDRDHIADLPSSFFDIPTEMPENQPENQPADANRDVSSPEMDYLEMDFDPSNNGDADTASENEEIHMDEEQPEENRQNDHSENTEEQHIEENMPSTSNEGPPPRVDPAIREEINVEQWVENNVHVATHDEHARTEEMENVVMPWSCTPEQRTKTTKLRFMGNKRVHCTRGELISPSENPPAGKGYAMLRPTSRESLEPAMIWSREEAILRQVTQIGPSSCGATAVLNVLNALRYPVPSMDRLRECVTTRLRDNDAPLAKYLVSRSRAGSTHKDIIEGLHKISNGAIFARFFHMHPERVVNLYTWLGFWIKNGAVPVATLNLQQCTGETPDAWHHQMIYGMDACGIHMTNPLEHLEAGLLWAQLTSESELLIRRDDVLSRWNFNTDLPDLMRINDVRWQRLNVVGQVANLVHENTRQLRPGFTNTTHVHIPAAYSAGITLVTTVNSPAYALLKQSPELPLLQQQDAAMSHCD